jgi:hypothetical protein
MNYQWFNHRSFLPRGLLRNGQSIEKRCSCSIFLRLIVVSEKEKLGISKREIIVKDRKSLDMKK